jgi:pathogenesis-related protein 1
MSSLDSWPRLPSTPLRPGAASAARRRGARIWGLALPAALLVGCLSDDGEVSEESGTDEAGVRPGANGSAAGAGGSDGPNADIAPAGDEPGADEGAGAAGQQASGGMSSEPMTSEPMFSAQGDDEASASADDDAMEDEDDAVEDDALGSEGETGIFVGMTAAHNAVRAELGLPELSWSDELAVIAQDWSDTLAEDCGLIQHRPGGRLGENIAARGSSFLRDPYPPAEAVDSWAAEVACWDYGTIQGSESCDAACAADLNASGCGHYTQIVWSDTREVGCGYSACDADGFTIELWVCNYDPPGNFVGQTPY